jgi:hypothetical protein
MYGPRPPAYAAAAVVVGVGVDVAAAVVVVIVLLLLFLLLFSFWLLSSLFFVAVTEAKDGANFIQWWFVVVVSGGVKSSLHFHDCIMLPGLAQIGDIVNRLTVTLPRPRDGKVRGAVIPDSVAAARAAGTARLHLALYTASLML